MIPANGLLAIGRRGQHSPIVWLHPVCLVANGNAVEVFLACDGDIQSLSALRRNGWEIVLGHESERRNLLQAFDVPTESAADTEAQERAALMEQAKLMSQVYGELEVNRTLDGIATSWDELRQVDFDSVRHRLAQLEHLAFGCRS